MITVNPIKTKYKPEGGDLVVGKVLELGNKLWRIHLNASNKAILNLNSINIEGIQVFLIMINLFSNCFLEEKN